HPKGGACMKLIKAVVTAGIAALVITSLPDIKRYFELKSM
ncbi:MAG: hypothetical protein JWM17_2709, partial [Actinobacteria bacterium]|nr:hypothetical protein [Actinomycetota bacterium]